MSNCIVKLFYIYSHLQYIARGFSHYYAALFPSILRFPAVSPEDVEVSEPKRHDQLARNAEDPCPWLC